MQKSNIKHTFDEKTNKQNILTHIAPEAYPYNDFSYFFMNTYGLQHDVPGISL